MKKYYNLGKNKLFLLPRSLTGKGTLQTLKVIKNEFPQLSINKIRSGYKVYDWKIPPEWNVKDAFIEDKLGNKIIVFAGAGAFLGVLIGQLPGAIIGAIIASIYASLVKPELKEDDKIDLQTDSSN